MCSDDSCAVKSLIDHEQITLRIMGWLSKFFKGSSHKISEGHSHDKYEDEPASYAPSHSGVITPITSYNFSSLNANSLILNNLGLYV